MPRDDARRGRRRPPPGRGAASKRAVALAAVLAALSRAGPARPAGAQEGFRLYAERCLGCHGPFGRGSEGRVATAAPDAQGAGPPLRGVGALAADFYLRTGYMPLADPFAQPHRRRSPFADEEIASLVAYVASLGQGPPVPRPHPERASPAQGLRLYAENCAGCHQIAGQGGVAGAPTVPALAAATPTEIAEAIRIGPYAMPDFPPSRLSDGQVDAIVRYVVSLRRRTDRGGWAIGRIGPVPEGLVAWALALPALVAVALALGRRAGR